MNLLLSTLIGWIASRETNSAIDNLFPPASGLNLLLRYIVGGLLIIGSFALVSDLPEKEKRAALVHLAASMGAVAIGVGLSRLWGAQR